MIILKTKICICVLVCILLASCGDGEVSNSDSDSSNENATILSSSGSCLKDNYGKPKNMVSLELVKSLESLSNIEMSEKVNDLKNMQDYSSVSYSWPSNRTITLGGSAQIPVDNEICIYGIRQIGLYGKQNAKEAFKAQFKAPTKEELKILKNALKKAATPDEEKVSTGLGNLVSSASQKLNYTEVKALGDLATWENSASELIILIGDWLICIKSDISDDETTNRKTAIDLANKILEGC